MEKKFAVSGMTCSACSAAVERSVKKLSGVEEVSVNLLTNSMKVKYQEDQLTEDQIISAVDEAGYRASSLSKNKEKKEVSNSVDQEMETRQRKLIYSFLFLLPLMYIAMGPMMGLAQPSFLVGHGNLLSLALLQMFLTLVIMAINFHYFKSGFKSLFKGHPNMDSLIGIGSGAAFVYGVFAIFRIGHGLGHGQMDLVASYGHELYFESAGTILVLISFGKWLEARAKKRTSNAISQLMDLTPKKAKVIRGDQELVLDIEDIVKGDHIILGPGENVPVDGIVLEGISSLDESALSGESIPVEKSKGHTLMAATTNGGGRLVFEATSVGEDTTIAKIIALVEDANESKAPISKIADRISGVFVPIVISISLITLGYWLYSGMGLEFALRLAIAVLVISCPCALGLATPVAIMVGTGKGAKSGILFKSAETLEILHHVDTILLDKTGTITRGQPHVTDVYGINMPSKDLLQLAYLMEKPSEHPLAKAVIKAFEASPLPLPQDKVEDFQALPGKGLKASYRGQVYYGGNLKLLDELGLSLTGPEKDRLNEDLSQGKTPLIFTTDKEVLGWICAKDLVKKSSPAALEAIHDMGIETVMLTGDNEKTAQVVARDLSIDKLIAGVLPQDKEAHVRQYQEMGKKVAMVGDGINDAPALARADVGVAIGAGTDIAIESADLVLIKSNLLDLIKSLKLSKATIRNIKQNLFWAFFYNVICIPIAAGVFYPSFNLTLNPMMAAMAMSFSSIFVVLNSLRLNLLDLGEDSPDSEKEENFEEIRYFEDRDFSNGYKERETSKGVKEENNMNKILEISGMTCQHCVKHVEKALNDIEGVSAKVSLHPQEAIVEAEDVPEEKLKEAVEEIGYRVLSIR